MFRNLLFRTLVGLLLIINANWVIAGSKWQLPLSGLDSSFVRLDRTWAKKADFLLSWPGNSRLLLPQDGTLIFAGPTGSLGMNRYGWILRHSENLYSVLTTSMPLNFFDTSALPGHHLRKGDVLASRSARFPAQADLRLHWRVLRLEGALEGDELTPPKRLADAAEVGVAKLLGKGLIEFDTDNPMLASDFDIDIGSRRVSGKDITANRFLIDEGLHPLAVVWGGIFKKSSKEILVLIGGDGLLVHQIRRDDQGQWNARDYDYLLPEATVQALARTSETDEDVDPTTKKWIDWLGRTPDADDLTVEKRDSAATTNSSSVASASLVPAVATTPVLINSVDQRPQDQERELAQQRAKLQQSRQEEMRRQELQVQQTQQEQIERERLVAEAVEVERKKRLDIEQRLAAAEARERERQEAELREKDRLNAAPKVYASRKALVIGNDQYIDVPKLNNAVADADAMALALQSVGFNVFKHINVDEKKFKLALRDFRMRLEPGDEVMVFFAGHGVQLNNTNYLLPIDIKGDNEEQIRDEAIQLQRVLDDLQDRRTKFALAVVDACRDNPFKGSGRAIGGRGLASTTAATGQMILFSAGAGQQALDRLGKEDKERNGLFTRIFVKEMVKPGVSVDRVLRNVRNEVVRLAKSVGHDQTPALYDQAVGDFFFRQ